MQTVSLLVNEIVFDIQNKTYLTGRSREAAEASAYETAANMQVSDDDENLYQLHRTIMSALCELKTSLSEYLDAGTATCDNSIDQTIEEGGTLKLELNLPSNYNSAALDSVSKAMHQYIVSRGIADWFLITNKTEADTYSAQAKQALEQMRRSLFKRVRPQRIVNE